MKTKRTRLIARRYAKALFDLAQKENRSEYIIDELKVLEKIFNDHPQLYAYLQNKSIDLKKRKNLIDKIMQVLSSSKIVKNIIFLLLDKEKIDVFQEIRPEFRLMFDHFLDLYRVQISVAVPELCNVAQKRIEKILSDILKAKIVSDVSVDPSILGGIVVRIGDTVIDNSVAGKLNMMKQEVLGRKEWI